MGLFISWTFFLGKGLDLECLDHLHQLDLMHSVLGRLIHRRILLGGMKRDANEETCCIGCCGGDMVTEFPSWGVLECDYGSHKDFKGSGSVVE